MIHYQLRCDSAHEFDGWFAGSQALDDQAARGLIACPFCGSSQVERALMAPSVVSGRTERAASEHIVVASDAAPTPKPASADTAGEAAPPLLPDALRAQLQRLRSEVEKNCVYVGGEFAAEARKIHEGDAPPRPIYGEASPEQAESLADDGIEIARIPWLPRADG